MIVLSEYNNQYDDAIKSIAIFFCKMKKYNFEVFNAAYNCTTQKNNYQLKKD